MDERDYRRTSESTTMTTTASTAMTAMVLTSRPMLVGVGGEAAGVREAAGLVRAAASLGVNVETGSDVGALTAGVLETAGANGRRGPAYFFLRLDLEGI